MSSTTVVTMRRQSANLADEANHRIANNLAVLAALMRLRAKGLATASKDVNCQDVQLILEDFAARLESVGKVHRLLAKGPDGAAPIEIETYLPEAAEALVSSLTAAGQTSLQWSFPVKCLLPAETAGTLALIVIELITNAVKYAHPAGVAGVVRIEAARADDGMLRIEVCDDGVGLPVGVDPLESQSFGFRTVRMLAQQLRANVSFESDELGLSCILQIPGAIFVEAAY